MHALLGVAIIILHLHRHYEHARMVEHFQNNMLVFITSRITFVLEHCWCNCCREFCSGLANQMLLLQTTDDRMMKIMRKWKRTRKRRFLLLIGLTFYHSNGACISNLHFRLLISARTLKETTSTLYKWVECASYKCSSLYWHHWL